MTAPLPSRRHRKRRCRQCGLHEDLCVCPWLPRVNVPFGLVLVQHHIELNRPTNSGRIACAMLPAARLLVYGDRTVAFDASVLEPARRRLLLLYPSPDAAVLKQEDLLPASGTTACAVLLDGTWAQASHMARRVTCLAGLPRYRLPPGPAGRWVIRTPRIPEQLCTLEAVVRLVALAGGAADATAMEQAMDLIMQRMLYMKGLRPAPDDPSRYPALHATTP